MKRLISKGRTEDSRTHDYRIRFSARRSYGFRLCNNEGSDCHSSSASSIPTACIHFLTRFIRSDRAGLHCARPTRAFSLSNFPRGSRQIVLYCAHRTSTFLSCAFCEQEERSVCSLASFSGRAFREHRTNVGVLPILFIVRVLRARRAPGRPLQDSIRNIFHDFINYGPTEYRGHAAIKFSYFAPF